MNSVISTANDYVSIHYVLKTAGIYVPEVSYGRSWKTKCPFGEIYHIDMGNEKSMSVYSDTNSAYCFQGCGYLTPVSLYSRISGLSKLESAEKLLAEQGYEDITDTEKWKIALQVRRSIDPNYLSSALQVYCSKIAGDSWKYLQYETEVLENFKRCLKILHYIKTEDNARKWLEVSKEYMRTLISKRVNNEVS